MSRIDSPDIARLQQRRQRGQPLDRDTLRAAIRELRWRGLSSREISVALCINQRDVTSLLRSPGAD